MGRLLAEKENEKKKKKKKKEEEEDKAKEKDEERDKEKSDDDSSKGDNDDDDSSIEDEMDETTVPIGDCTWVEKSAMEIADVTDMRFPVSLHKRTSQRFDTGLIRAGFEGPVHNSSGLSVFDCHQMYRMTRIEFVRHQLMKLSDENLCLGNLWPSFGWMRADTLPQFNQKAVMYRATNKRKPLYELPAPSFRQRNVCTVEMRLFRLAEKGWQLNKAVACPGPEGVGPPGCGRQIRRRNLRHHLTQECPLRTVVCRFREDGEEAAKGTIVVRGRWIYCNETFPESERESHELHDCAVLKARRRQVDLARDATEACMCQFCNEEIPRNRLERHEEKECAFRIVECPKPGCGMSTSFHRLASHLKFRCKSDERSDNFMHVDRARKRSQYARPWGFEVPVSMADLAPAPPGAIVSSTVPDGGAAHAQLENGPGSPSTEPSLSGVSE
jgi:hypothetical protein